MTDNTSSNDGQCALVVGAGHGLGKTVALTLARAGYAVVVAARTKSEVDQVAAEAHALQTGTQRTGALAVAADATQPEQVAALVQSAMECYGRIDVLVNCAGEALIRPTTHISVDDFERIIRSNLTSTFLTCRAVMPVMMRQQSGHIVNIASRVARDGALNVAAYSAAKAGVVGFSKALGQELKPYGVKVSVLCPGPMDTPMRWAATPDWDRAKVIAPQRIADIIAMLVASPDTSVDELYPYSMNA